VIRIVLVGTMALVRSGIRTLLVSAGDFDVPAEGTTAEDAVRLAGGLVPDIVVLDSDIERILPAIRAVKQAVPACDVVVLTNRLIQTEAMEMFEEGASGYVCKDIPGEVLLSALRMLRNPGEPWPINASMQTPTPLVHVSPRRSGPAAPMNGLTPRERDILVELATGSTDTEIATKLNVREGTVKTHIRHILRKLGVRNRTAAIAHALRERLIS